MSGQQVRYRGGVLVGDWTEEEALAFIARVEQIARCPMAMPCLPGLPTCAKCKGVE